MFFPFKWLHILKQPRAFDRRRPKTIFWNSHFRFKFPTPPRQSQIPHPRDGLSGQIPDSPGKENIQMSGVRPGGGGCWDVDVSNWSAHNLLGTRF